MHMARLRHSYSGSCKLPTVTYALLKLLQRMRVVQQAHLPCLVPESAAAIDIILGVGIPIPSKKVGSCVGKQP